MNVLIFEPGLKFFLEVLIQYFFNVGSPVYFIITHYYSAKSYCLLINILTHDKSLFSTKYISLSLVISNFAKRLISPLYLLNSQDRQITPLIWTVENTEAGMFFAEQALNFRYRISLWVVLELLFFVDRGPFPVSWSVFLWFLLVWR